MNAEKYGFIQVGDTPLPELKGTLRRLRHERTGLELGWLDRDEENMTFGIAFETLPWDDTGVFHILEHSVLCGSDKFPVKEPFVELLKNSMNTFLNAMTYPDKTCYPVCSRNKKDFLNLMEVYLDAVFRPRIYSKPEIFGQEGWHYVFGEDGKPGYRGVVFNEMKGVLADPDELTANAVNRALFPDSPYRFNYGGDPFSIPDLTWEKFVDSHKRFYSPSNATVFLDGAVDIDAVLALLDGDYLSKAQPGDRLPPPPLQPVVDGGVTEVEYELGEGEDPARRTRMTWAVVAGTFREREKLVALQLLGEVLCGDNQSPLSRVILDRDLAESVSMQVGESMIQPVVTLNVRNLRGEDKEQVAQLIWGELERTAKEGLDKEALEAAMANLEFKMRERDFGTLPQGLALSLQALETWLYGGDPAAYLEVGGLFDRLREKAKEGYFEQLIREVLLDGPHRCQVILTPSETAGEARRKLERDRLERESAAWDEGKRAELLAVEEKLTAWQQSQDDPEALASLPTLELSDISPEPEARPTEVLDVDGVKLLYHDVNASGIVYFSLFFDAGGLSEEELSALSFLTALLGELAAGKYSGRALADRKKLLCGNMDFAVDSFRPMHEPEKYLVKLHASFSALEHNVPQALSLMSEILTATSFQEEGAAREILRQEKMDLFQHIIMRGNSVALGRVYARLTAAGVASERANGFAFYQWLAAREDGWDWADLSEQLSGLLRRVAGRDRLTVSVTGGGVELARRAVEQLARELPQAAQSPAPVRLAPWAPVREGIAVPADVSFAVLGGDLTGRCTFSGELTLAARVVSLGYLWNVIRVQGGAYGTGLGVRPTGLTACYSFRDPSAARSLEKYRQAGEFLREFCQGQPDLTGAIIGAVAALEPLLTPRLKGRAADADYWTGRTLEDRRRERRAMLEATPDKLRAQADVLEAALGDGCVCVVGGKEQLAACGLDEIQTLK